MLRFLATAQFDSPWYWVLHAVVWCVTCSRTLGVPYDMLLRAGRSADVAARVDLLASIAAERVSGFADRFGPAVSSVTGFLLAGLAVLGAWTGLEWALATFLILAPFAAICYSKVRLSLWIRQSRLVGPRLVLALSWRRTCHQAIAVLAMLAAIAAAAVLHGSAH